MKHIAIVTGASSGMGAEFARQLTTEGRADELWIVARRIDRLQALADELKADRKIKVRVIPEDISGRLLIPPTLSSGLFADSQMYYRTGRNRKGKSLLCYRNAVKAANLYTVRSFKGILLMHLSGYDLA